MKKKLSIIITALILSILAAGCSVEIHEDSGKQDAKYYLYDISSDETQLQKEATLRRRQLQTICLRI